MTTDKPLTNRDISRVRLLDASAATRCPLRTHLTIEPPPGEMVEVPLPVGARRRMEDGRAFEDTVMAEIEAVVGPIPRFASDPTGALAAMAAGLPFLAQAELVDEEGRRVGRPDLLVALPGRTSDGKSYYLPVEIKAHLTEDKKFGAFGPLRGVAHTALAGLDPDAVAPSPDRWARKRPDDLLQLAHYHRLLEHLGHAGAPLGAVIGSERVLTLLDLAQPTFQSWRNTKGKWSSLDKYDREFGFRLDVAALATARAAGETDELPLVVPARNADCDSCQFEGWCAPQMEAADELTLLPGLHWDVRQRLHADGITTRRALTEADRDSLSTKTIKLAADQARVQVAGIPLARARDVESLTILRADVEVDVDMECTADGRVYLWGCLLTDQSGTSYTAFSDFSAELDAVAVFGAFWGWLDGVRLAAEGSGRSFAGYCYAAGGAENKYLHEYGPQIGVDVRPLIASDCWVDLHDVVKAHVLTGGPTGLKTVAQRLGFSWRHDDAGGDQSMVWYDDAIAGAVDQQERLLRYNEDDVRATLWVRDQLAARWDDLPDVSAVIA